MKVSGGCYNYAKAGDYQLSDIDTTLEVVCVYVLFLREMMIGIKNG